MLAAVNRRGRLDGKGQSQRVGAPRAFKPNAAGDDVAPRRAVGEDLIAQRVEHDALRVGERDHEIRPRDLGMKRLHLGQREAAQRAGRVALARDLRERRNGAGRLSRRVEA